MIEEAINETYDEELDQCLNLVSFKELETNLHQFLTMNPNEWVNVRKYILPDEDAISEKVEAMWCSIPDIDVHSAILIFFLNKDSLEVVNVIYYQYKRLMNDF